jgi:hypothetical protein
MDELPGRNAMPKLMSLSLVSQVVGLTKPANSSILSFTGWTFRSATQTWHSSNLKQGRLRQHPALQNRR